MIVRLRRLGRASVLGRWRTVVASVEERRLPGTLWIVEEERIRVRD
jgi:hypothetical protein